MLFSSLSHSHINRHGFDKQAVVQNIKVDALQILRAARAGAPICGQKSMLKPAVVTIVPSKI